jgi:hypothetical protein
MATRWCSATDIRLQRYCEPLRLPKASDLSLAGVRLVIADHAMGLPVLRTLSLCTCCRHYPGAAAGHTLRSASPSRISLPREGCRVGAATNRDTLTEGFIHFVSSMTAPVASGWSDCRVGLLPLEKRCLCTAHTQLGHWAGPTIPMACFLFGWRRLGLPSLRAAKPSPIALSFGSRRNLITV